MKPVLRTFVLTVCLCFSSLLCLAQLPNGTVAPDFTLTDLDGNTIHLQSILDQGKTVVIDFSATWCGPCWSYHNTHALADLWNDYGPDGTDEYFVMFIEGDTDTELACLYGPTGCTGGTQGNWVASTPYPIVNVTTESVVNDYQIGYWPTIYTICPDGYVYESGQVPTTTHYSWKQSCVFDANLISTSGVDCYEDKDGQADVDVSGGAGVISYSWSNGQTGQDLVDAFPGTYSLDAIEGNGLMRTITNVVIPGPDSELIANVSNASDISCNGANDGVVDISTLGGTPGYSFQWSNGATSEDISNLPGATYSLVVTDDNGCAKALEVEIIDPDAVDADVEMSVENCGRNDATITASGSGGTGSLTYTYGPETNHTGVFTSVSAGTYNVVVTDDNNCQYSETITVDEIPAPTVETFPADPLDCATTSVTLSAAADVGNEFTYLWTTTNGNIISGKNSLTPVVDAPGDYQIIVINNINGCFSQASVTVEGSSDLPSIHIADPAMFSCSTTEVVIDATNSSNGADYTFTWTTTDGVIVSGENTDMLVVSSSGTYILVLTNTASGCSTTSSVEVEEDADVPAAMVASPDAIDCDHLSITLDGSGSSQGEDYEYEWSTTDGVIISAIDDEAIVGAAGTYVLTVVNTTTGCSSMTTIIVDDVSIFVDALYIYETNQLEVEFENLTTGNPTGLVWNMGNGDIIDGDISSYTYDAPGTYMVCLVAENGCGDNEYCLEIVVTKKVNDKVYGDVTVLNPDGDGKPGQTFDGGSAQSTLSHLVDVTVYPNPTSGMFAINLTAESMVKSYQLVNMEGQLMMTRNVDALAISIELDASKVNNGTYFIQIQLENDVIVKPVVIIK